MLAPKAPAKKSKYKDQCGWSVASEISRKSSHQEFVVRTPPGGGGVPPRILTNKRILVCSLGNKGKLEDPGRRQAARKFHQYLIDFVKEIASEEGIFQNFPPAAGNLQYYIVEFI